MTERIKQRRAVQARMAARRLAARNWVLNNRKAA